MEHDERDSEIVKLLSKLKGTGSSYPVALLASRRQRFLRQVATLGFGTVAAVALKETAKAAGGASIPSGASIILETVLIVAIVAEAGYVAIVHRERILDWFQVKSAQPTVEEVNSFPDPVLPTLALPVTGPTLEIETVVPAIEVTLTPTITIIATPSPGLPALTATEVSEDSVDGIQVTSTPQPHDDNGDPYGQTPGAERTQESGGGGGSDPTKDDPKPTDSKNNNGDEGNTKDPKK